MKGFTFGREQVVAPVVNTDHPFAMARVDFQPTELTQDCGTEIIYQILKTTEINIHQ